MADSVQLFPNINAGGNISVGHLPEIELDTGLKASLKGHFKLLIHISFEVIINSEADVIAKARDRIILPAQQTSSDIIVFLI